METETSHKSAVYFYSKLDIVVLESFVPTTRSFQLSIEKIDKYKTEMGDSSFNSFLFYFLFFSLSSLWYMGEKIKPICFEMLATFVRATERQL